MPDVTLSNGPVTPSCYARFEVWVVRCGTCLIAAAVLG